MPNIWNSIFKYITVYINKVREARIVLIPTYPDKSTEHIHTASIYGIEYGVSANKAPNKVAAPFPPLNL